MALILLVLILAIVFGGLGFILHALWWLAAIVLVVWLVGFAVRAGEGRRWYRWSPAPPPLPHPGAGGPFSGPAPAGFPVPAPAEVMPGLKPVLPNGCG